MMHLALPTLSLAALSLSLLSSSSAQSLIYVLTTQPATTLIGPGPLKTTTAASGSNTAVANPGSCYAIIEPPSNKDIACDYYAGYCSPDSAICCQSSGGTVTDQTVTGIGAADSFTCSVPGPKIKKAVRACLENLSFSCYQA